MSSAQPGCFLAEWYRPGLDTDVVNQTLSQLDPAEGDADPPVRLLALIAAPDDDVVFGVFAAESSASVTAWCQSAGLPVERLTAGVDARICLHNRQIDRTDG